MADAVATPAPAAPAAPVAPPTADAPKVEAKTDAKPDAKVEAKAEPKGEKAPLSKHKLVIDGAEEEVELEELIRLAQKGKASDKRFDEAAKTAKETREMEARIKNLFKAMKEDPRGFAEELSKLGGQDSARQIAEAILVPLIEAEMQAEAAKTASPEQKRLMELEAKVKEYEKAQAQQKAAAEKAAKDRAAVEHQAKVNQHIRSFEKQIIDAIEESGLPKSESLASEVVEVLQQGLERGLQLTPKDIVAELKGRKTTEFQSFLEKLEDEKLTNFIPKAVLEKIRKAEVAKFKSGNPMLTATPAVNEKGIEEAKAKKTVKGPSMAGFARDLSLGKF